MYLEMSSQAKKWLDFYPQAQIRAAGARYSRGAVQEADFLRSYAPVLERAPARSPARESDRQAEASMATANT